MKKILIVDDDEDILFTLDMAATKGGFLVVTASNGQQAAQKVADSPPDLVVTDLSMPGQGGFELLRALQGSDQRRIPVIVVSGKQMDQTTIDLIRKETNVIDFLPKPVASEDLVAAIKRALGQTNG